MTGLAELAPTKTRMARVWSNIMNCVVLLMTVLAVLVMFAAAADGLPILGHDGPPGQGQGGLLGGSVIPGLLK